MNTKILYIILSMYIPPKSNKFYIPLQFYFCKHVGLSIPLIALQYHEVKIVFKLRDAKYLNSKQLNDTDPVLKKMNLYCDYIFLSDSERREFAKEQHSFLIEQVQSSINNKASLTTHNINFNHPIKELVWAFRMHDSSPVNFSLKKNSEFIYEALNDPEWFSKGTLRLNGEEQFSPKDTLYFSSLQPYFYHTRIPLKKMYLYSFSIKPEEHIPTGHCNFSRFDSIELNLTPSANVGYNDELLIFGTNYNILNIQNGMGGLLFSD